MRQFVQASHGATSGVNGEQGPAEYIYSTRLFPVTIENTQTATIDWAQKSQEGNLRLS